jgi:PAS domain S-box-containing protein
MELTLARAIWTIYLQAEGLSGLLLILVCGTLYAHRRRAYFLYWTLAWFVFSLWRLFNGLALSEHWLSAPPAARHPLLPFVAAVCGWWHVGLWVLGLLHWRYVYQSELAPIETAMPDRRQTVPALWLSLSCIAGTAGVAILMRTFWPAQSQAVLSVVMAGVYGASAVWFAVHWWHTGQLGVFLLPLSLGLGALARLYSVSLALRDPSGLLFTILYQNALLDFLLQTLTVVAMIVVLLGDEAALLRQTGQRLAESEDRFRLLFEYGGVGMALLSPDGNFLQVNPALAQMLGYLPGELTDKHILDIMYAEDRSSSNRLRGKTDAPQYEREKRFLHRDGSLVWARMVRVPIRDVQAVIRYHAVVFVDVTQRKHAERALREERDFIAQVLQIADALILVLDAEGRILRFNNKCQAVSGRSAEEVRGRPFWECLLPQRAVDAAQQGFQRLLTSSDAVPARMMESSWRTRSGDERLIAWRQSLVRDEQGQPRLIIGIGLDVTEQRRMEEQLGRGRKMQTLVTLVGGIAHDFNNQLTAILGNLDMLGLDLQQGPVDEALRQRMQPSLLGAERAAQRCARMTARLLTFSRGRLGTLQTIALDQLLLETVGTLQHELPGVKIEVHVPSSVRPVTVDVSQMQELLLNLSANAREAMSGSGTLTLSLADRVFTADDCAANLDARPGSFVELCVRDTGRGMPSEVRDRIFEPFFTTKKPGQGVGMGLSVVFGIVKGHKGWITVHSKPGEGTAFHIYLPAAQTRAPSAPPPTLPEPAHTPSERILIVDDEPLVRDLAKTVLERMGFRVVTAEDGDEALDIYRREANTIDLILLDYIMPRMNGLQVLKELQQLDPQVCVLFSSGYHMDHEVDQLLAAGARAFVAKPYRAQDLVQSIRQVLKSGKSKEAASPPT